MAPQAKKILAHLYHTTAMHPLVSDGNGGKGRGDCGAAGEEHSSYLHHTTQ